MIRALTPRVIPSEKTFSGFITEAAQESEQRAIQLKGRFSHL